MARAEVGQTSYRTLRFEHIEFENVSFRYDTGPEIIGMASTSPLNRDKRSHWLEPLAWWEVYSGEPCYVASTNQLDGRILLDGVDYRNRSLAWLQSKLGIVLQQPHLFSGTIGYNIRYAKQDATQEEIETAARIAGAHEFHH